MRLLLLNSNTNTAMTSQMAQRAEVLLGEGVEVMADTAPDSVGYVRSRRECAVAGAAVVSLAERYMGSNGDDYDAILLACFGEPGMAAVREISPVPVIGMLEASVLTALQSGERFSIVTPGYRWPRMIEDALNDLGVTRHCLGIDAIDIDDLQLPEQRDEARSRLQAALSAQHRRLAPDVIIIGGAALAGLANELPPLKGCRMLDSLDASLVQSLALMRLGAVPESVKLAR